MANRVLTPQQMLELCQKVGKGFVVIAPVSPRLGSPFSTVHFKDLSWEVGTADSILPDDEFIEQVRSRLWDPWHNAHWQEANKDNHATMLAARGAVHGDYMAMAATIQATKDVWRRSTNWDLLHSGQKEALELIATKIGRILTGDPGHKDHWDDGAGYFTKGAEICAAYNKDRDDA